MTVKDSGPGLSEEAERNLFLEEDISKPNLTRGTQSAGISNGVGLKICKKIC